MASLLELEDQIEECLGSIEANWVEVGMALATIREERLYKPQTFHDWLQGHQDWKITRRRADQLIRAAKLVKKLENKCSQNIPSEAVARPILSLPEAQQEEAWRETCAEAETEDGGAVKARHSQRVVASRNITDLSKTSGSSPPRYLHPVNSEADGNGRRRSEKDAKKKAKMIRTTSSKRYSLKIDLGDIEDYELVVDALAGPGLHENSTGTKLWCTDDARNIGQALRNLGDIFGRLVGQITLTVRGAA